MKKLMLLGGLRYLKPVIDAAHRQGYFVITADYLPDNIAHKWSDAYCNVSIIDKEAVLREAQRLKIDGIMYTGPIADGLAAIVAVIMAMHEFKDMHEREWY